MQPLLHYFPDLSHRQIQQFAALPDLYNFWNQRVNLISRKDLDNLIVNHVLHSISLAKFIRFIENAKVLDLGTGGGFPAIPLSILFPDVAFVAIDGTAKKIKVVNEIAHSIDLKNLQALHMRAEDCKLKFHFVVSRAVAELPKLWAWAHPLILPKPVQALPNGLLAYKGGNIAAELKSISPITYFEVWNIAEVFNLDYYKEKYLVYVQK